MNYSLLRAGDWLFRRGEGFVSDVIDEVSDTPGPNLLDGKNPSHVAQVVEEVDGSWTVREMTTPKACSTPLLMWLRQARTWVAPMLVPWTEEQKGRLRAGWDAKTGAGYDYLQIPVLWVRLQLRKLWAKVGGTPVNVENITGPGVCSQNVKWRTEDALQIVLLHWIQSPLDLLEANTGLVGRVEEVSGA